MKNTLGEINSRLNTAEVIFSDLENIARKIIKSEIQGKKDRSKNEQSLSELRDNLRQTRTYVNRCHQKSEGLKYYLKK